MNRSVFSIAFFTFYLLNFLRAQPGSLDPSFGIGGVITMDEVYNAKIGIFDNGKILAFKDLENVDNTYDILLKRFNHDGSADDSFGVNSRLAIDFSDGNVLQKSSEYPRYMEILPNGKILICGSYSSHDTLTTPTAEAFIARFEYDGRIDSSFGINGKVVFDVDNMHNSAQQLSVLPNGDIILFLRNYLPGLPYKNYSFVKLTENGSFHTSFGQAGIISHYADSIALSFSDFCAHPDGEITLAGDYGASTSVYHFDKMGEPDFSFAQDGHTLLNISWSWEVVRQVEPALDGKFVTCGYGFQGGSTALSVCRFLPNGNLDSTFNGKGFIIDPVAAFDSEGYCLTIQPDGKIIAAGYGIFSDLQADWLIARYNSDGTPDESFGNNGYVRTDFQSPSYESASQALITPDSKLLVTGTAQYKWVLARYEVGNIFTPVTLPLVEQQTKIELWPNPIVAAKTFHLRYFLTENTQCQGQIFDLNGNFIQDVKMNGLTGWNDEAMNLPDSIPSGTYVLKFRTRTGFAILKLVIL